MKPEQNYFIAVINQMPANSIIFLQASDLKIKNILDILHQSELKYYKWLLLNEKNKELLINEITNNNLQDNIESLEIRKDDKLLFEGFDKMDYGVISKDIYLSNEFIEKFVKGDMCIISSEW